MQNRIENQTRTLRAAGGKITGAEVDDAPVRIRLRPREGATIRQLLPDQVRASQHQRVDPVGALTRYPALARELEAA